MHMGYEPSGIRFERGHKACEFVRVPRAKVTRNYTKNN